MKRKVKRYDEGGGIFEGLKEGLSKVFRKDDESKYSDLESVGGAGRRQKTIEEQIKGRPGRENEGKEYAPYRREPEPSKGSTLKPESESPKGGTTYTNQEAIERDVMGVKPEKESKPAKVIKAAPKAEPKVAPKAAPKSDEAKPAPRVSPKKSIGEDVKPAPAKPSDKKEESKPLPGKPEAKAKEPDNYISPKKIQEERSRIAIDKREKTKSPVFPLKEDEDKQSDKYISPKKIQEERRRIVMKKRESDKAALQNRKEYGMKKGGSVSSASKRADGIAMRGKTKGRIY